MSRLGEEIAARAEACTTDGERWAVIREAWELYCAQGAGEFDWDYDSRDLMRALTGHTAFEWMR